MPPLQVVLNRLSPLTEERIIDQQAGFRPGKSTRQLLNLTHHIEDGYEQGVVTGTAFVDQSAANDTISHTLLLNKIYRMTSDTLLCELSAIEADGRIRRMVFQKAVGFQLCYSTFTRMTNQYTRTRGVLSTQMTCVLQHIIHHLRRPSQPSAFIR